ncbi:MFS transporter [Nakamurella leprariae]|uniref:MFS transporter n=1 Tax=Nakamurella leprariae TaxID=2803911 RepID=A0A938YJF2_9ACTN|nr:MFS transporter [Nakamurella leprariae]MBM9469387.1 MFS transporter [Nakamurella leprariae]
MTTPTPSDAAAEPAVPTAAASTRPRTYRSLRAAWIPLAALCLAFFVEMVDNTLLSIALPTIGRDLHGSTTSLQWITGAYSLTFGGLLLTAGSIADRFGRRRVLQIGLAAFGLMSLAVLAVTTTGELIALRAGLGIAAAAMAPITNSLVFRLFDDQALRMRAMSLMIVVGMSGFILGPLIGGTALTHVSWQWLLLANAPIALIAFLGVRFGVAPDRREDLTADVLDLPAAALTVLAIGLGCWTLTSGVEHGWLALPTVLAAVGALAAAVGFVARERRAAFPMLDLRLLRHRTVRGATLAQIGTSIAMAGVMFSLVLHFQFAYGWSPLRAGLANLPFIVTMLAASPLTERLVARFGRRVACLIGAAALTVGLAWLAWAVEHGYLAIAIGMVLMTVGLRTVMTICAVGLIDAVPENRTSLGAALNDTAQEVGTSIGTALIGTLIAALVVSVLPLGAWSPELVSSYFHGERIGFLVFAGVVGLVAVLGAATMDDSRTAEERHPEPAV